MSDERDETGESGEIDEPPRTPTAESKSKKQAALEKAKKLVGTVISDRYQVEEVIAAGGMGCVFRGQHMHMRKRVAIKVLLPETEGLPDLVLRFEREAIAGAHIDHQNVAAATDFGKLPDGSYFLVLQYVRGITLHDLIKQGPIPPARAVRIARQIGLALDACHQMGVVHRDVKPRNIMLEEGRNDFVKLIDFGLAKVPMDRISTINANEIVRSTREVTGLGVVFGTIAYISPEAAFGMAAVNERSDLYAFGIILYEMLAGAHPFDTRDPGEMFRLHRAEMPPPIRVRAPGVDIPPRLEAVVTKLVQKDPSARFESARAVIAALDAAVPSAAIELVSAGTGPIGAPIRLAGALPSAPPAPLPIKVESPPNPIEIGAPKSSEPPPRSRDAKDGKESKGAEAANEAKVAKAANEGEEPEAEVPAAPEEYVPRLGRPASPSMTEARTPSWAIGVSIAIALVVALGTALLLWRSREGGAGDGATAASNAIKAESGLDVIVAKARAALDAASKPAAPPGEAVDSATLRARMRAAADSKEWGRGADALLALVELDTKAFDDRDAVAAVVAIAAGLELGSDPRSDKIFDALTSKLGPAGLDILFAIMSTRGGSKAATRATEILKTKEVLDRASPALRIAIELREAPCKDKLALLPRAKTDGDLRAIAFLDILRSPSCNPRVGQCCYKNNGLILDAIHQIRARLRTSGE